MNQADKELQSAVQALSDAVESQDRINAILAEAEDLARRANALSYEDAKTTPITDPDFSYLNSKVEAVLTAKADREAAEAEVERTSALLASAKEKYDTAKENHRRTSNELAIAKTTYESFLPKQNPKQDAEKSSTVAKISDNQTVIKSASGTVRTGDTSNAGAYSVAFAGSVLALGAMMKKRRTEK